MTVTVLEAPPSVFDEEQTEAVRDCLRQITDDERPRLWALLEPMLRAISARDVSTVTTLVSRVAEGPIRKCLLGVAKPFLAAYRAAVRESADLGVQLRQPHVYGRARQDFLGMFTGLSGIVAPVEIWACRTGLYWEKVEADAFAGVETSRRMHTPVPLDYRHHGGTVLGCSRRWELADDGALFGTFDMGGHPPAQHAARAAQRGELGLSMSVRFRTRWLAAVAPDEWDANAGALDVCVRDAASVEAVALTPAPTYPTATVASVW